MYAQNILTKKFPLLKFIGHDEFGRLYYSEGQTDENL